MPDKILLCSFRLSKNASMTRASVTSGPSSPAIKLWANAQRSEKIALIASSEAPRSKLVVKAEAVS